MKLNRKGQEEIRVLQYPHPTHLLKNLKTHTHMDLGTEKLKEHAPPPLKQDLTTHHHSSI